MVNRGGLVAYGGMIGGFLASVYCCRKRGIPLLQWADVAAPSVVLGTAITRVGCLLFGCDFGARSSLPWAIRFPQHSPAWNHHVARLTSCSRADAARSFPVHPTQVYESLVGLFLFGMLMLIRKYRTFSGQVFLGWVLGLRHPAPADRDRPRRRPARERRSAFDVAVHRHRLRRAGDRPVHRAAAQVPARSRKPRGCGSMCRVQAAGEGRNERRQAPQDAADADRGSAPRWRRRPSSCARRARNGAPGDAPRPRTMRRRQPGAPARRREGRGRAGGVAQGGPGPRGAGHRASPHHRGDGSVARVRRRLRRRLDEMEARLGENDRRDDALAASGAGREASLFKFRDDGFAMRSPNGRFLLMPHLRAADRLHGADRVDGARWTRPRPTVSGFTLPHAEVILEGHVGSRLFSYRLQLDAAESPTINDAYVQIGTLARRFGLRVGQFKVPYGLQRWTCSGELEFVDHLDADGGVHAGTRHRPDGRSAGRSRAGSSTSSSVTNGSGAGRLNDNIDLAYAARVVAAPWGPVPPGEGDLEWHPRPRASFGVAGYYNLVPTDLVARTGDPNAEHGLRRRRPHRQRRDLAGGRRAEGALARGVALQAEWFGRYEVPGGPYASRSYWGAYAQAGYFVIRGRLQVAARFGHTDVPLLRSDAARPGAARRPHHRGSRRGERLPARPAGQGPGRLHALPRRADGDGPGRALRPEREPRAGGRSAGILIIRDIR